MGPLNVFYEEPDSDRWIAGDRYPRRIVRRLVRGAPRPGGQMRVFLNLVAGLDRIGIPYRVNDYRYARAHPEEVACIVGKPFVLDRQEWRNPIIFGSAVFSHPAHDPSLLDRRPVRRILVPGEWMRRMFEPFYGERVISWPVGIDTARWRPSNDDKKDIDLLVYDKVRWEHARFDVELLEPIRAALSARGLSSLRIRYGSYEEAQFEIALRRVRAMVFVCEHETQGIAYQQALACGVPILAWDRGGWWQDPEFFPRIKFGPVSSVPYWDSRCGETFADAQGFGAVLEVFWSRVKAGSYDPRAYILDHLTLEACAAQYAREVAGVVTGRANG